MQIPQPRLRSPGSQVHRYRHAAPWAACRLCRGLSAVLVNGWPLLSNVSICMFVRVSALHLREGVHASGALHAFSRALKCTILAQLCRGFQVTAKAPSRFSLHHKNSLKCRVCQGRKRERCRRSWLRLIAENQSRLSTAAKISKRMSVTGESQQHGMFELCLTGSGCRAWNLSVATPLPLTITAVGGGGSTMAAAAACPQSAAAVAQ